MPGPDPASVPLPGQAPRTGWTAWHPGPAVLDLVELVVTGALPRLPEDAVPPERTGTGQIIEDAEGTPVAALGEDGRLSALRPFSHPPLRSHRLTPAQVRTRLAGLATADTAGRRVFAVPVTGPLTDSGVRLLTDLLANQRSRLLWVVLVGADRTAAGPGSLSSEALLRAVRGVAAELEEEPVVVPVALPVGHDHLLERVARSYGGDEMVDLSPTSQDPNAHPAFATELAHAAAPKHRQGLVVFFTGLSGSGKSTVAKALAERVLDAGLRTVSLLDGDEVRRLLSAGLGFTAADRAANIARIGFVAAEVARHGGMAVAAPIAPFARGRAEVRRMVEQSGGVMVLVHVATPLAECERRDRKGLYARARRGEVPEFTGISSPYERPTDADVVIDTTGRDLTSCVDEVWRVLQQRGLLVEGDDGSIDGSTCPR